MNCSSDQRILDSDLSKNGAILPSIYLKVFEHSFLTVLRPKVDCEMVCEMHEWMNG